MTPMLEVTGDALPPPLLMATVPPVKVIEQAPDVPLMVKVHSGQRVRGFTSYTRTRLIFELESGEVRGSEGTSCAMTVGQMI